MATKKSKKVMQEQKFHSSNRLPLLSLFLAAFLIGNAESAYAEHGSLEFCNQSSSDVKISGVYRIGLGLLADNWHRTGWLHIDANSCSRALSDLSAAVHMYVGIKRPQSKGGRVYESVEFKTSERFGSISDYSFCVDKTNAFDSWGSLRSLQSCSAGETLMTHALYLNIPSMPLDQHRVRRLYFK